MTRVGLLLVGLALAACQTEDAEGLAGDAAIAPGADAVALDAAPPGSDAVAPTDSASPTDAGAPTDSASPTDAAAPADSDAPADAGPPPPPASSPPAYGIFQLYGDEYARFRQAMGFSVQDYWRFVDDHVARLDVRFTRTNTLLIWGLVEPELGAARNFNGAMKTDDVLRATFAAAPGKEMDILVVIDANRGERGTAEVPLPALSDAYRAFVTAAVERYDGDGIDDLPGTRVKYWQVMNEPVGLIGRELLDVDTYVEAVDQTWRAMAAADPEARLVLGDLGPHLRDVLPRLPADIPVHAVDLHYWPDRVEQYEHPALGMLRTSLDAGGRADTEIWMTEFGVHVNQPGRLARHTAEQQAAWLVKAMLWSRARGVGRILWNNLVAWTDFNGDPESRFNFMGLVSGGASSGDPAEALGQERLAWFTYQRLIAATGTRNAELIGAVDGLPGDARVVELRRLADDAPIYVGWSDSGGATVELPCPAATADVTDLVPAADGRFAPEAVPAEDGRVSVALGVSPRLIEPR